MDDSQRVMREMEESLGRGGGGIAAALADRVGDRAGVRAVFGEPVERDGVTVIPVGRVRWCFGGGGGSGGPAGQEGKGSGGGGGVAASPAGYIEVSGGTARYRRIRTPPSPGARLAAGVAVLLVAKGLQALLRGRGDAVAADRSAARTAASRIRRLVRRGA
ncbi:MAG: spore germination protein GerW family protein [Kineosporiaceae bacterium]